MSNFTKTIFTFTIFSLFLQICCSEDKALGTLIFSDDFNRNETQDLVDEPGNGWTTSSNTTAKGYKQVYLKEGALYVVTHKEANHATSTRHTFQFTDGSIALKFKLDHDDENLNLNFADMTLKEVHAGHLFSVSVNSKQTYLTDLKTGAMNLNLKAAKTNKTLTPEQQAALKTKSKTFPHPLTKGVWHDLLVTIQSDTISVSIDQTHVGSFSSEGFSHSPKGLLRLLVNKTAWVDDLFIYRKS